MEYGAKLKCYIEGIRLMSVEVEMIEMIINGVIPKKGGRRKHSAESIFTGN